ncbi:MAG: DUF72 domain-containing protein, partial [Candidatus Levyibacteriota bacterium]
LSQRKWLSFYAEQFSTVEINNSFYVSVKPETYEKWYRETPGDFVFTIKGHRYITQFRKLKDVEEPVELFFSGVFRLEDKLKCILWQFPRNFSYSEEHHIRLETFLKLLPQNIEHAFEFREEGWFREDVRLLLAGNNSSLVISSSQDFPEFELPVNFSYLRFHGPKGLYSSSYSLEELNSWAEKIKEFKKHGNVYAYFNNDAYGYAPQNAKSLIELLS